MSTIIKDNMQIKTIKDNHEHFTDIKKLTKFKGDTHIQWKGTDVCIDIYCPKCKVHSHFDGDFMYYYRCPKCKTVFAMGTAIEMIELSPEHITYIKKQNYGINTEEGWQEDEYEHEEDNKNA